MHTKATPKAKEAMSIIATTAIAIYVYQGNDQEGWS